MSASLQHLYSGWPRHNGRSKVDTLLRKCPLGPFHGTCKHIWALPGSAVAGGRHHWWMESVAWSHPHNKPSRLLQYPQDRDLGPFGACDPANRTSVAPFGSHRHHGCHGPVCFTPATTDVLPRWDMWQQTQHRWAPQEGPSGEPPSCAADEKDAWLWQMVQPKKEGFRLGIVIQAAKEAI